MLNIYSYVKFDLDVNECETGEHKCQHLCENTKGGYKCHCKPGYIPQPDGNTCKGITTLSVSYTHLTLPTIYSV